MLDYGWKSITSEGKKVHSIFGSRFNTDQYSNALVQYPFIKTSHQMILQKNITKEELQHKEIVMQRRMMELKRMGREEYEYKKLRAQIGQVQARLYNR